MTAVSTKPSSATLSSKEIISRSEQRIAGGVVSLNRKTSPHLVFVRATGAYLYDAEDRRFIDFHAAFAPHLLGHGCAEVTKAVGEALDLGWSLMGSGTTPWEMQLAEILCEVVPSLERVQILNTGSEASNLAIRLSRAFTHREDIVTTLGGYNGWHDEVGRAVMPSLEEVGPRVSPGEYPYCPISAGIPVSTQRRIHTVGFNDLESIEYVFRRHKIACLITEPVLQNIGVVLPEPGYLRGLRKLCDDYGVVLIFDEVKTGFRSALGGYQSLCGVRPDLSIFGKAVANGYPLGVLGGRAEIMGLFGDPDPNKRVLVAGTYNGHPVNVAAAMATLNILRRDGGDIYRQLETKAQRLEDGLKAVLTEAGWTHTIVRNASAFCIYFMDHAPQDWHDILLHHDFKRDQDFRQKLIEEGIYQFPVPCKQASISAAHSDRDIDETVLATAAAVRKTKIRSLP